MKIREPALGITFEPTASNSVQEGRTSANLGTAVVWGANWVSKIDLDELESTSTSPIASISATIARKKRAYDDGQSAATASARPIEMRTTRRYQPLALFGFITHPSSSASSKGNAEAVVIERTWFDLAKELPEAWIKSGSFGT
jgi:U3 small nucleolar RNA-associated protein 4